MGNSCSAPDCALFNKVLAYPVIPNVYHSNIIPSLFIATPHNPSAREGGSIKNRKSPPPIISASIGAPNTRLQLDLWNNLLLIPRLYLRKCTGSKRSWGSIRTLGAHRVFATTSNTKIYQYSWPTPGRRGWCHKLLGIRNQSPEKKPKWQCISNYLQGCLCWRVLLNYYNSYYNKRTKCWKIFHKLIATSLTWQN